MKKTTEATTEIAEVKSNLPATAPLGFNFMGDVGQGMEGTDQDSFAIPFLKVIQKMSPEVDEAEAEYIPEARPGMFINSVTRELFDGKVGVVFIPCAFQRRFLRWAPRGAEGGFKGEIYPEEAVALRDAGDVVEKDGKLFFPLPDGTVDDKKCDKIVDTRNHFGLLFNPETGEYSQVLLSLSSTQIKKSKRLMSMLSAVKVPGAGGAMVTPPTWANMMRITSASESNDHGTWHGVNFTRNEPAFVPSQELYDEGKKFHELVSAGEAKVNYAEAETASAEGEDKF